MMPEMVNVPLPKRGNVLLLVSDGFVYYAAEVSRYEVAVHNVELLNQLDKGLESVPMAPLRRAVREWQERKRKEEDS